MSCNLPGRLPQLLRCAVFGAACMAVALPFYASMLPDCGGAAHCARKLGWNPQEYGASFSKQWLLNGTFWRPSAVFRYKMSPADFARMKQDMQAEGITFRSDAEGVIGTVTFYYYIDSSGTKWLNTTEGAYLRGSEGHACNLTYNETDELLYAEVIYGH